MSESKMRFCLVRGRKRALMRQTDPYADGWVHFRNRFWLLLCLLSTHSAICSPIIISRIALSHGVRSSLPPCRTSPQTRSARAIITPRTSSVVRGNAKAARVKGARHRTPVVSVQRNSLNTKTHQMRKPHAQNAALRQTHAKHTRRTEKAQKSRANGAHRSCHAVQHGDGASEKHTSAFGECKQERT